MSLTPTATTERHLKSKIHTHKHTQGKHQQIKVSYLSTHYKVFISPYAESVTIAFYTQFETTVNMYVNNKYKKYVNTSFNQNVIIGVDQKI
jgi:hypothetical protein